MSLLDFDKGQLSNLEESLRREFVCVSDNGSYASSTMVGCNTRKYHGLFVCRQPRIGQGNFVLLSSVEETVIQRGREFHIGVKQYGNGIFEPKGHKYIESFRYGTHPVWNYHVGGVRLCKELFLHPSENRLFLKYTLLDAHSATELSIRPFLAFRSWHELTYRNDAACTQVQFVEKGIKCCLYPGFSDLCMQLSSDCLVDISPDWYRNVEYACEADRGYPAREDLFTPGVLRFRLEVGKPVYFCAGTSLLGKSDVPDTLFRQGIAAAGSMDSLESCLEVSARSFIVRQDKRLQVVAGYPWFGTWGRDTFISLPGLALCTGHEDEALEILRGMVKDQVGGLFPNMGSGEDAAYNSVDAPLWFVWAVQQYAARTGRLKAVWEEFGPAVKEVIGLYAQGTLYGIGMTEEGLIHAGKEGYALTWMDAVVNGKPVTQRDGMPVEINALWYNAVMFAMEAEKACQPRGKNSFCIRWKPLMDKFPAVFKQTYWDKEKGYLADTVKKDIRDWSIRPNQIFAVSLPYSPVSEKVGQLVVDTVRDFLLTPRGLRTLAPSDSRYKGVYQGDQAKRDMAYHQGTAWVWLLGHFASAYLRVYGEGGKAFIEKIFRGFEPALREYGLGSIAEIYDGDPSYAPKGAFSQAWSVAELLRIREMIGG